MADDYFVIITAAYEPGSSFYRSLESVAPELEVAGLSLVDERTEPKPSRTWAGMVDGLTFEYFADVWQLPDEPTDDRPPATRTYTFDGMNWETDGTSPIVYVTLHVLRRRGAVLSPSRSSADAALGHQRGGCPSTPPRG
jgi:hypothetical protein